MADWKQPEFQHEIHTHIPISQESINKTEYIFTSVIHSLGNQDIT